MSLNSLTIEPSLIAKCLLNKDFKSSINNVLSLSCASKIYRYIIYSEPFFRDFVKLIDPAHPLFVLKSKEETPQVSALSKSSGEEQVPFKQRYFELRNLLSQKSETFPGTVLGEALASEDGVEVISFGDEIISFKLKKNLQYDTIKIPESMRIPPREQWGESPFAARSEKFLAINPRCNSAIYIFTPDAKVCLAKFEVEGEICQITIERNLLCVVQKLQDNTRNLVVINPDLPEAQEFVKIALPKNEKLFPPPRPICFGKEYLFYTKTLKEGNQIFALPLSCLHPSSKADLDSLPWIKGTYTNGYRYLFPYDKDFIEVIFNDCNICDVAKICIRKEELLIKTIAKDVLIPENKKTFRPDVYSQ